MKRLLLAASFLTALALPAQAHFILADEVFADLGGTGFGNAPRLLTIQSQGQTGLESGAVISQNGTQAFLSPVSFSGPFGTTLTGIACSSQNSCNGFGGGLSVTESHLTNVTSLWTSGAQVGVGLDTNQTGSTTGLLFNNLVLNIYSSTGTLLGAFGGNDAVLITQQQLADQQGNGNSVFNLGLTLDEQTQFNAIVAGLPVGGQIFAGLAASMGCAPTPCIGQGVDGAESFLAFQQSQAVAIPAPIVGAGLPGLVAAVLGMFGLNRFRRRRQMA
jgi:hypothetical protein